MKKEFKRGLVGGGVWGANSQKKLAKKSQPTKTKQAEPKKKFSFFFLAISTYDSILSPTPVYLKNLYL